MHIQMHTCGVFFPHTCDLGWNHLGEVTGGQREVHKNKFLEVKASVLVPSRAQHLLPYAILNKASVPFCWVHLNSACIKLEDTELRGLHLQCLCFLSSQSCCCPLLGLVGISGREILFIFIFIFYTVPTCF